MFWLVQLFSVYQSKTCGITGSGKISQADRGLLQVPGELTKGFFFCNLWQATLLISPLLFLPCILMVEIPTGICSCWQYHSGILKSSVCPGMAPPVLFSLLHTSHPHDGPSPLPPRPFPPQLSSTSANPYYPCISYLEHGLPNEVCLLASKEMSTSACSRNQWWQKVSPWDGGRDHHPSVSYRLLALQLASQ